MSDHRNELEEYVAEKFQKIYKYARPTIGSGCTPIEKGDIKNPFFMIECKIRNTKSFSIKDEVWKELKILASKDNLKEPLYIVQNVNKERLAIMNLDDWFSLFYEIIENRNKND